MNLKLATPFVRKTIFKQRRARGKMIFCHSQLFQNSEGGMMMELELLGQFLARVCLIHRQGPRPLNILQTKLGWVIFENIPCYYLGWDLL